jgi:membrane protease YdiL (CAAX protease family)
MGLWSAIAVNTSIYALIHLPKGKRETIGAIPLGIVLCLITSYTGTIWAAFWIHCTLALTNEWFSIKYTKDIVLNK